MTRFFYRSSSDMTKADDDGVRSYWYTFKYNHDVNKKEPEEACKNPWNGDEAEIIQKKYFFDNCVISIRPAQSHDGYNKTGDHHKTEYFFEISNHDASIRYSSHKLYNWEAAISLATMFKGLSFSAAQRVWQSKKP